MSGIINIQAVNLEETRTVFEQDINQMSEVKHEAMMSVAEFLMTSLVNHVHYGETRTFGPHMRDVIRLGGQGEDFVEVVVPTRYAQIENARPGIKEAAGTPHNFADMAQEETEAMAPDVFFSSYSELFSNL